MSQLKRLSGILLHPTSLPSKYGIGDLGQDAYDFIDYLEKAGQHLWQVLPLTHTGFGDSPYQSFSAYAGQPLLISIDHLIKLELVSEKDIKIPEIKDETLVDYGTIIPWKHTIYKKAYESFLELDAKDDLVADYEDFCEEEAFWLEDYSLYMAIKDLHQGKAWTEWEDKYRLITDAYKKELLEGLSKERGYYAFLQFMFFTEWRKLKAYANKHDIDIIGDIPIFVSMDSADVWANRGLFKLDTKGFPTVVAGVPPDYFSKTGQLWGNPLYKWEAHEEEDFAWWIKRVKNQLRNVDILRIDHFRGFEACWTIPYGEKTAINGKWVKSPGEKLFKAIQKALGEDLPIIAEDLGIITEEVEALRDGFNFPGMKVLQFAFDSTGESNYHPHNFTSPNCICYTGTHDNDTILGWYSTLGGDCKKKLQAYTSTYDEKMIGYGLVKLCLSSTASYAIFPLQDTLFLGSEGRMNTPGVAADNWQWRFKKGDLLPSTAKAIKELVELYGRANY